MEINRTTEGLIRGTDEGRGQLDFKLSVVRTSRVLWAVLLLCLLIDIGGGIGVKYVVLAIIGIFTATKVTSIGVLKDWWVEAAVVAYCLLMGVTSIAGGASISAVYSELSFLAFFVIVPLLLGVDRDSILRTYVRTAGFGAIIVIATFIVIGLDADVGRSLNAVAYDLRIGYIGLRPGFDGVPNVYYRWSLWLVLGFALSFPHNKPLAIIFAIAVLLTMSTALVSALLLICLILAITDKKIRSIMFYVPFGMILVGCILVVDKVYGSLILDFMLSKFSTSSFSTSVKMGHIVSAVDVLLADWKSFLVGTGPGTSFYSTGVNDVVTDIEVSHFNVIRQYGVIGAAILFGYIATTLWKVAGCGRDGYRLAVGLFAGFLVAGTNPLLLSPVFFVPLLIARVYEIEYKNQIRCSRRAS